MKRMLAIGLILLASGCGDPEIAPQPATSETESPAHGPWSGKHKRPKFIVDDETVLAKADDVPFGSDTPEGLLVFSDSVVIADSAKVIRKTRTVTFYEVQVSKVLHGKKTGKKITLMVPGSKSVKDASQFKGAMLCISQEEFNHLPRWYPWAMIPRGDKRQTEIIRLIEQERRRK